MKQRKFKGLKAAIDAEKWFVKGAVRRIGSQLIILNSQKVSPRGEARQSVPAASAALAASHK